MPLDLSLSSQTIDPQTLFARPATPKVIVSVLADPVTPHLCRLSFQVPATTTLMDIVIEAGYVFAQETVVVAVDDTVYGPDQWSRIHPQIGSQVRILPRLAGGGGGGGSSKVLRSVMLLAVAAAAAYAGPAAAGIIGLQATGTTATAFATVSALVSAATTALGSLLVNALIPPPPLDLGLTRGDRGRTEYLLSGQSNRSRPFEPIRLVLGKRRIAPDLWAQPVQEWVGNQQYFRAAYCFGWGPLFVENLRIGETLFDDYDDDLEYNIVQGLPGDPPPVLYTNDFHEEPVGVDLPGLQDSSEVPVVRTTLPDVDEIQVVISLPLGVFYQPGNKPGRLSERVRYRIDYAETGTDSWQTAHTIDFRDKISTSTARGHRWSVSKGQYDVRVTRLVGPYSTGNSGAFNRTDWASLVSIKHEDVYPVPGLSYLAVRIKATSVTSNQLNQISADVTSICPDWDPDNDTWITRPTQNPASLHRYAAQGPWRRTAVLDADVDLVTYQAWAEHCIDKDLTCNAIFESETPAFEALGRIAAVGEASTTVRDGKLSIIRDRGGEPSVAHITSADVIDGSLQIVNRNDDLPHGLRVRWVNSVGNWEEDIVYWDGYSATNATRFEEFDIPDVDNWEQAYRLSRLKLADMYNRPRSLSFDVDWTGFFFERGDPFDFTHLSANFAQAAGLVTDIVNGAGGVVDGLELDRAVHMDGAKSYQIKLRGAKNDLITRDVVTVAGSQTSLTLVSSIDNGAEIVAGCGWMFGEATAIGRKFVVTGIEWQDIDRATIIAQDAAPAILTAPDGPIPSHTNGFYVDPSNARPPPAPVIVSVDTDDFSAPVSAIEAQQVALLISLGRTTSTISIIYHEIEARRSGTAEPYRQTATAGGDVETIRADGFVIDEAYEIRARAVGAAGASPWSATVMHRVRPPNNQRPPMPIVRGLELEGQGHDPVFTGIEAVIAWQELTTTRLDGLDADVMDESGTDPTFDHYRIDFFSPDEPGTRLRTENTRDPRFVYTRDMMLRDTRRLRATTVPDRRWKVEVRAVGTAGEISPAPAELIFFNQAPAIPTLKRPYGLRSGIGTVVVDLVDQIDPDFAYWKVYASQEANFDPTEASDITNNMVVRSADAPLVFAGVSGATYYVVIEAWDQFGPGGQTDELSVTIDRTPAWGTTVPGTITAALLDQSLRNTLEQVPILSSSSDDLDARMATSEFAVAGISAGYSNAIRVVNGEPVIQGVRAAIDLGGLGLEVGEYESKPGGFVNAQTTLHFVNTYEFAPIIFAHEHDYDFGADPSSVRLVSNGQTSAVLSVQEETSHDTETGQAAAPVDYLIAQRPRMLTGKPRSSPNAESDYVGQVINTRLSGTPTTLSFDRTYTNPVVIFGAPTANQTTAVWPEITALDGSSVTARLINPPDGTSHGEEQVGLLIMESGSWILDGDIRIDAGTVDVTNLLPPQNDKANPASEPNWSEVSFAAVFPGKPSVFSNPLVSAGPVVITQHRDISISGFEVGQQEAEVVDWRTGHVTETIGWVAVQRGVHAVTGTVQGVKSDYAVYADAFRVINPTDGAPVQPLSVHSGQVFINSAMIQEVTASQINVTSLSALSASSGAFTITDSLSMGTNGEITTGLPGSQGVTINQNGIEVRDTNGDVFFDADGLGSQVVASGNIIDNAVSDVAAKSESISMVLSNTSWQTAMYVPFDHAGQQFLLGFNVAGVDYGSIQDATIEIRILTNNGQVLMPADFLFSKDVSGDRDERTVITSSASGSSYITTFTPHAENLVVWVQVRRVSGAPSTLTVDNMTIYLMGLKK